MWCNLLVFLIFVLFSSNRAEISDDINCNPNNSSHVEHNWIQYKKLYNKTYTKQLDEKRRKAWFENCVLIHQHNRETGLGKHNFTLRLNNLADLTYKNYQREMIKLTRSNRRNLDIVGSVHSHYRHSGTPKELDWRDKGFVTPPQSQKQCGSCYAFSIAHILEAQLFKKTDELIPLSEQQLVDCSSRSGNFGCAGGSLKNTLHYLESAGGLEPASRYPYKARETRCNFHSDRSVVNVSHWAILPPHDEWAMERTVANVGPVAVSLNASPQTFQLYHGGIYDDISCPTNTVNHAMIIVGYTQEAWILKNWWGEHWGENGYMRLRRNRNQCGVSNFVAYATID